MTYRTDRNNNHCIVDIYPDYNYDESNHSVIQSGVVTATYGTIYLVDINGTR